jgi:hypothetical protein
MIITYWLSTLTVWLSHNYLFYFIVVDLLSKNKVIWGKLGWLSQFLLFSSIYFLGCSSHCLMYDKRRLPHMRKLSLGVLIELLSHRSRLEKMDLQIWAWQEYQYDCTIMGLRVKPLVAHFQSSHYRTENSQ